MSVPKRYLGDGVYVEWDGCGIIVTTENGIRATNRIVLEPCVYSALADFVAALVKEATERPPLADCVSCDGYVLTEADAPYCPSCARDRAKEIR